MQYLADINWVKLLYLNFIYAIFVYINSTRAMYDISKVELDSIGSCVVYYLYSNIYVYIKVLPDPHYDDMAKE